ncbi:MAG: hypothetical protein ACYDCC_02720 [Actinomycetota bacterium]
MRAFVTRAISVIVIAAIVGGSAPSFAVASSNKRAALPAPIQPGFTCVGTPYVIDVAEVCSYLTTQNVLLFDEVFVPAYFAVAYEFGAAELFRFSSDYDRATFFFLDRELGVYTILGGADAFADAEGFQFQYRNRGETHRDTDLAAGTGAGVSYVGYVGVRAQLNQQASSNGCSNTVTTTVFTPRTRPGARVPVPCPAPAPAL